MTAKNKRSILCVALVIFATAVCIIIASIAGCGKQRTRNNALASCSPDAKYCDIPAKPTIQRYEITRNSNIIVQLAEPTEVDAWIHMADHREPTRAKVWLDRGTWAAPERMFSISEAEARAAKTDVPFQLAGTR